jgi:valyl-tRNA synthetase
MSEIPKAYDPRAVEDRWYQFWLDEGCFTADPGRVSAQRPAYSIVIPPPNVTGVLTMGHVLNNTIQDLLARKARMDGKEVLWLPGTDHAGIATQTVVEKTLRKQGLIRHRDDLGREKFLEHVWAWKEKHGGIIIQQLKKLGCSCDWTRERFTMDPEYSRCVQKVFVDLYRKGLIYRGKRMVNWCPISLTALSDEEVIMKEQQGFLYYFRVQVVEADGSPVPPLIPPADSPRPAPAKADGGDAVAPDRPAWGPVTDDAGRTWLTIATTRPETIPADTAVAVNPADLRYARFIGKFVKRALPLENQALLPIIGDEHIDMQFGTGVLKVTPAHDPADYEIGLRHKLPVIDVLEPDGTLNARAGRDLAGLDRMVARQKAAEVLEAAGALVRREPYVNKVGFSERADVPIEPRLSEQWFLKYPSVDKARACVAQPGEAAPDKLRFHPDRWAKVYDHWMANLKDWCISRQLWWGHRIPVWYSEGHGKLRRRLVVTELTGRELPGRNIKELRQAALEYAAEHGILGQSFLNLDTGQAITVHKSGLEHGFSNFGVANVKLVPGLPALLRHAIRVATEPHRPPTQQVLAVETYLTALRLGDQLFRVKFRVKVLPPNLRLYDHQTVRLWREKQNEPDGLKSPEVPVPKDPTSRPASGSPLQLADLVPDVNRDPAFTRCQVDSPGPGWTQDPDVLDTWFSSWLWPFATMGWTGDPEKDRQNATLQTFYPTTDLVTGPDIIFFWVARMIMAGYEFMGEKPFRNVYFTGIIRDKLGRKMSKSLGNSPDPLDLIARYGADALRFGTLRSAPLGQDVLFDEQNVELGRNFCNKLWNACRFRQLQSGETEAEINPALLTGDDRWILLRLDRAIREVSQAFAEYKFSEAAATLHRFFWNEYCDWYVEAAKATLAGDDSARRANTLAVMDFVLNHTLRLFHPFLPFITEELWHGLGYNQDLPERQGGRTLMFAPWPKPFSDEEKAWFGLTEAVVQHTAARNELVSLGRNLRREFNLPAGRKLRFVLKPAVPLSAAEVQVLRLLLNAETVEVQPAYQPPRGTPCAANALGELFLPLEGLVDFAAERARLTRELEKARAEVAKVREKLANPNFVQKVPPQVLEDHQRRLAEWQERERQLSQALANLPEA